MDDNSSHRVSSWIERQEVTSHAVDISIVVPAYNEEWRLPPTLLDMVDYFDRSGRSYEIIVVDDGSSDGTAIVVRKFERVRASVRLIELPRNYGKGHAVKMGVLNSRGARILFADADGATPIAEFDRLDKAIDQGADVSIGSRALRSTDTKIATAIHRKLLGRMFNWCVNVIVLPGIADTQCGFKLFTRRAALFLFRRQRSDRFSFDVELLYVATRAGLKTAEIPINWTNIPGSKVNLVFDAIKMFRDIFRFRVIHRSVTPESFRDFVEHEVAEDTRHPL